MAAKVRFRNVIIFLITIILVVGVGLTVFQLIFKDKISILRREDNVDQTSDKSDTSTKFDAFEENLQSPPVNFYLGMPVDKEYLDFISKDSVKTQRLVFFLPKEAEIRAVFDGTITKIIVNDGVSNEENPVNEVVLTRSDGEYWAAYLFVGETEVEEDQKVSVGSVLAKTITEVGSGLIGGGNLAFWVHNRQGEMLRLSKDLFK